MILGVPVALIAEGYLVGWFILWKKRIKFLIVFAILGALASSFYMSLFFNQVAPPCLYCIGFHVVNFSLLLECIRLRNQLSARISLKLAFLIPIVSGFMLLAANRFSTFWITTRIPSEPVFKMETVSLDLERVLSLSAHFGTSSAPNQDFVFFADPSCTFCALHFRNFVAFQNAYGKYAYSLVPLPQESICHNEGEAKIPNHGVCAALALLDCLPVQHRLDFYETLSRDTSWKLISKPEVFDHFYSFFDQRGLKTSSCNKQEYRKEFAELLRMEEEFLPEATPVTYFRGQWFLGAFQVSDFLRIVNQSKVGGN
jgi:hypothetical protein